MSTDDCNDKIVLKLKKSAWEKKEAPNTETRSPSGSKKSQKRLKSSNLCSKCRFLIVPPSTQCMICRRFSASLKSVESQPLVRFFESVSNGKNSVELKSLDDYLQTSKFLIYLNSVSNLIPRYLANSCIVGSPVSEKRKSGLSKLTCKAVASHLKALRIEHIQRWVRPLVQKLMIHSKNVNMFNRPVDPVALGIPDYFDVVKCPMDLGSIRSKLQRGFYENVSDCIADMDLVFQNAMTFNASTHPVHQAALHLSQEFSGDKIELLEKCSKEVSSNTYV
jgi:hypothetical protein